MKCYLAAIIFLFSAAYAGAEKPVANPDLSAESGLISSVLKSLKAEGLPQLLASCKTGDGGTVSLLIPINKKTAYLTYSEGGKIRQIAEITFGRDDAILVETNGGIAMMTQARRHFGMIRNGQFLLQSNVTLNDLLQAAEVCRAPSN